MVTQTKDISATQQEKAVIVWQEGQITVSFSDVKQYLCPKATEPEIIMFLKTCQAFGLNPWVHEAYLIKYKTDDPAAIIISTEAYQKGAENCKEFDGYEAGIILKDSTGKLEFREGAFAADGETDNLAGGWARVFRKDRQKPFYVAVNIKECQKYTREGYPTRFWREMPSTMVRKVALSRALREAFPTRLGGIVTDVEVESDGFPTGKLPPAYEKPDGEINWRKFWGKVKSELGLTTEQARELLQVESIKEELIDADWSMEKIWDELIQRLQVENHSNAKKEHIVEETTKSQRDPDTINSFGDLYQACREDFGLSSRQAVWEKLEVNSQVDIVETPKECYERIAKSEF
ncbi:MAG: phage recombination protein Bet [Dehalococcoidales bacterium]|nr:phage recombination protein Bet [Dehalococcoidales bacterium]